MAAAAPGAVCGTETGEFSENYYVSDTLAGLGRISYAGKAEPMTFEALSQVSGAGQNDPVHPSLPGGG